MIPLLYGRAFAGGVLAAQVLLVGLAADGFGGVVNAYLYGTGRPGLASIATAAGLVVTGILDVALIPGHGILGAAIASTCAYLAATGALLACFRLTTARPRRAGAVEVPAEVHRA